jgi:hypothetical protein
MNITERFRQSKNNLRLILPLEASEESSAY